MGKISDFFSGLANYGKPVKKNPEPKKPPRKPRADIVLPAESKKWTGIIWHHSLTKDTPGSNWGAIVRFHTSYRDKGDIITKAQYTRRKAKGVRGLVKPWRAVAYQGGVDRIQGKLTWHEGRAWTISGAHAGNRGFNSSHLGLCAIGNFDLAPPEQDRWEFCLAVTRTIMDKYGIPKRDVIGHRETYDYLGKPRKKSCPGNCWDMDKFRSEL